jgi:hypothetical protein
MARINYPVKSPQRELSCVAGSFAPNGSSAVAATSNRGTGFTVARTGTGQFTVTFTAEHYYQLVSATATLQLASAADTFLVVGTYTAPTATANGTLVITAMDNSAGTISAADVSANANNRINFVCFFKDSAV